MPCASCGGRESVKLPYEQRSLCGECFCQLFERRVRNGLRGSLPSKGRVGFDISTPGGVVAMHVIRPFAEKARNECFELPAKKLDLVVAGDTLDDEVARIMRGVIEGEAEKAEAVKPLARCAESEVRLYAKLKKIKLPREEKREGFERLLRREIDLIEERHPGTKYAILNSGRYLEQVVGSDERGED